MFNLKSASLAIAFSVATIGVVPAHASTVDIIRPHSSRYYSYTADQGEVFAALLSGDGDSDLDLVITNQNHRVVCTSQHFGDDEYCRIRSPNGGTYTIEVKNLGDDANVFMMDVN